MSLNPKSSFHGIGISEIRKMNALARENTINLGIGQLPNDIPSSMLEQGQKAFSLGITRYTSNQGMLELRELIANYHSIKTKKHILPEQVVVTNGAEGALWNILYTFLEPTDEILIPEVAFSVYDTIACLQGSKVKTFKMNEDFSLDINSLEDLITNRTKFVVINSPNNPTGSILPLEDVKKLAELAKKRDFYIISDEIYSELYIDGAKPVSPYTFSDRVIIVDGISKRGAATGLRIGWTVSPIEIAKPMVVANQYISTCASSVSQYTAIKSLDGSSDQFVEDVRSDLKLKRDYVYKVLSGIKNIKVVKPEGAFYIFPDISKFGKSKEVAHKILEEVNVLTIPGVAFGDRGDNHIRLSFAVEFNDLKEALNRITDLFNSWS
ncbi:MAG: pyridoxal phosphate-dependent aminotransferase [Spirochaetaceae bacterium]